MFRNDEAKKACISRLHRLVGVYGDLNFSDSWINNKNLVNSFNSLASLYDDVGQRIMTSSSPVTDAEKENLIASTVRFLDRFEKTSRYNIGVGAMYYQAPRLRFEGGYEFDYSSIDQPVLSGFPAADYEGLTSGISKVSPAIFAQVPWVKASLIVPSISSSSTFLGDIQEVVSEAEDPVVYVRNYRVETEVEPNFELNIDLSLKQVFKGVCADHDKFSFNWWACTPIPKKNHDFSFRFGLTNMDISQVFQTELRIRDDVGQVFSQLTSVGSSPIVVEEERTEIFRHVGFVYSLNFGDQFQFNLSGVKNVDSKDLEKTEFIVEEDRYGISLVYYYF